MTMENDQPQDKTTSVMVKARIPKPMFDDLMAKVDGDQTLSSLLRKALTMLLYEPPPVKQERVIKAKAKRPLGWQAGRDIECPHCPAKFMQEDYCGYARHILSEHSGDTGRCHWAQALLTEQRVL